MTDGRVVVCCVSRLFIRMYLSRSRYASSLLLFLLHSLPLFSPLSLSYMHPSYINSSLLHLFLSFLSSHHLSLSAVPSWYVAYGLVTQVFSYFLLSSLLMKTCYQSLSSLLRFFPPSFVPCPVLPGCSSVRRRVLL